MSDNMDIWNSFSRPPKDALKQIKGGRLRGMTDVNPQWRIEVMTEKFGPIGFGWYFEEVDCKYVNCGEEIAVFVNVNLYFRENGAWSAPIPGTGGNTVYVKEKSGLHLNDEAKKMATTDALGTAMKCLGVAADIYKGLWDGSKYVLTEEEAKKKEAQEKAEKKLQKARGDWFEAILKLGEEAFLVAFEESGYVTEKQGEEALNKLMYQVNTYEKLETIKNRCKEIATEGKGE